MFISHLDVDHIAGLQGIIALHWFRGMPSSAPVTVYGPPGTEKLVAGIVQSMGPTEDIAKAEQPGKWTPADSVKVVIVKGGSDITVDGVRVRAVQNSHFDNPPGHPQENGTQSLSYRFDYQGYAIGYTGDTGPSDAVAKLEDHVNLLVSEVTERGALSGGGPGGAGRPNRRRPGLGQRGVDGPPSDARQAPGVAGQQSVTGQGPGMGQQSGGYHFEVQHLSPENAGKVAAAASAQRLVFTHLAVAGPTDTIAPEIVKQAQQYFKGEVVVAHDLDRF